MKMKEQNVLFFTRTMKLGGTENVVLQLCEIFKPHVNKIVVCSCGGVNVEKLTAMNIKHYKIDDIESKKIPTMLKTISWLKDIVRKENITIIHTHHRMAAFYISLMGLYKKCVFLNTSHNTFTDKLKFTKFAYKHAHLVACGEMVKKNLTDVFGLTDVTVVHNAVKPFSGEVIEDPLLKQLKADGCFLIGNVGRLSEQKGMEYFIQAIPEVLKNYPHARFLIVGTGEDENKLKELVKTLEVDTVTYFMGYRSDIQNLISQMDLVVLSSLWEGLPLTPIEAFSVGKTIVATAVDGTVEIVTNMENGLLIEPKNFSQIAEKVLYMIEHPEEREEMERKARECYLTEFSFDRFAEKYIDCYRKVVK